MNEIEIKIVIPSMGRADRVLTTKAISNAVLCVPESEAEKYELHNPGVPIVTHPDTLKGLTMKRQFIMDSFGAHFQIDDDIKYIAKLYVEKGENAKLTPDEAYDVIQMIGNCAKLAGCYLFGLSKEPNPLSYNEMHPIGLSGILNGDLGILPGSKLFFHESAKTVDDYWMSALNAHHHRYCWIDRRFCAIAEKTFTNAGGMSNHRTAEQVKQDTLFLRKMFGSVITLKEDKQLAKRKFEFQPSLHLPF